MNAKVHELWWISKDGENEGPYTVQQIESMWNAGSLNAKTLCCREGDAAWLSVLNLIQQRSPKRILPAIILWFFLGAIGAHAFYAGRIRSGVKIIICLISPAVLTFAGAMIYGVISRTHPNNGDIDAVAMGFAQAICFAPWVFGALYVLFNGVQLVTGSYQDGAGVKIEKWT